MPAYYNELDPYAAEWLRNLISAGHIAPGDVDTRDIKDVSPDDLAPYDQCHFFAGIGVWSRSLRDAGWPDDQPVWTGSCPCQPFSAAGRGEGEADERHLWPHWFHLVEQRRPPVIFGEQVASKDGLGWLDLVQSDLEGSGYASGFFDLCAAGVGAPHIRQRLYFCAYDIRSAAGWLVHGQRAGLEGHARDVCHGDEPGRDDAPSDRPTSEAGRFGRVGDCDGRDAEAEGVQRGGQHGFFEADGRPADRQGGPLGTGEVFPAEPGGVRPGPTHGFWGNADWLFCRDGRWRPVEPGTFPLAHGVASRVGRLRAYGNAIVAPLASTFIEAATEALRDVAGGPGHSGDPWVTDEISIKELLG